MPSSIFYMEDIFHQHIKVFRNPQHKLGRWGAVSTFYPADSFGAVSDSSGKVILVNATLFPDFSDIIGNRHKNPFFSMLQPLQRERLMKNVCCGLSSRAIAKQEGVYYSSVDKSIAAAKKNFIKFYENL